MRGVEKTYSQVNREHLYRLASKLHKQGANPEEIEAALLSDNRILVCSLDENVVREIAGHEPVHEDQIEAVAKRDVNELLPSLWPGMRTFLYPESADSDPTIFPF